jgi:hypothetical protein
MSISHNMFIRGINAIYAQAEGITPEQVKPFTFFCIHFVRPLTCIPTLPEPSS